MHVRAPSLIVGLALITTAACGWWRGEKALITARLETLVAQLNASAADGPGTIARAAHIGQFFTDDVLVELGPGSTPISGRETLIAVATRLGSRMAGFTLELADVNIHLTPDDQSADITLTAGIVRHSVATGEPSMDAREFALVMRKVDGDWRIARLTAVDTLK